MKKLLLFIMLLSFVKSYSQFTIPSTYKPAIGDTYNYYEADTTGVMLGSSGSAQVWDYTTLTIPSGSTLQSTVYIDATSIPNYALYPGAYMAISDGGWYYTYDSDPNNLSMNWAIPQFDVISCSKYTNPYTIYHYPISYTSSFIDSVKHQAYNQYPPSQGIICCGGSSRGINSYTCTGYGTLNLPNGVSIPNTLKLNILYYKIAYNSDDSTIFWTDSLLYEEYFNAISKFPVLAIKNLYSEYYQPVPHNKVYSKSVLLNQSVINSLKDYNSEDMSLDVFPNPSDDIFNIDITSLNKTPGSPKLNLYNSLGLEMELISDKIKVSKDYIMVNLNSCESGIYYLKLAFGDKFFTKKLLVD